ncbi:MAG: cytochrome P450, partial [Gammaproteobacteria bacterium]|nr:cytochrome P450 [Gammaproteobacteria bacterium]
MEKTPVEPVIPTTTDEINLLDVGLQNCPYHAYKLLRDEAPVWQDPATGFFVVTQFGDLRRLLLDTEHFSNGSNSNAREQVDSERAKEMRNLYETKGWVPAPTLAGRDDPNHKQMRSMFDEAFRPARINSMEPLVEGTARKLMAAFVDDGHCDWVQQFSVPMPLIIIGQQ